MLQTIDLKQPDLARHYMAAMHVMHDMPAFDWYDGWFLAKFEAAQRLLAITRPDHLHTFADAFDALRTRETFAVHHVAPVLGTREFHDLLMEIDALPTTAFKSYENADFGRRILHDLPTLGTLQMNLMPLVARIAGEAVEPAYNFLSLYETSGRCPPHLDAPSAKWTLDLCLAQNCDWPIYFSPVVPWPTADEASQLSGGHTDMSFQAHLLNPNEALIFSGSAQWHYRDAIPPGGFCHLAFLHYHPAGCADLLKPARWGAKFELPELSVLDAVFDALRPDSRT